jgi:hypothetical protein
VNNIEYEFNKDDDVEFQLYYLKNNPAMRNKTQNSKYILIVYFFISILVSAGFFIYGNDLAGAIGIIIGLFIIYIYWAVFSTRSIRRRLKKELEADTVKIPNGHYCKRIVTIEPYSIKNVSDFWEVNIYWHGIVEIKKTEQYIYLFETQRAALVIPKRAFADDNSFDLFADMAKEYQSKAISGQTIN